METGISRTINTNGKFVFMLALDHLNQSIADILTTPIGTRVMRPEYGSNCPRLIDRPLNKAFKLDVYAAAAEALHKWEPRIKATRISVESVSAGYAEITVKYVLRASGAAGEARVRVRSAS